jgi:AraC-like DNA-binding protein
LETARVLILERKKKFGEIADLLNYSSLFSFSKAFKAKYGISPRELQVSA